MQSGRRRAGINILSVEPTLPGRGAASGNDEDERLKRVHSHHGSKGRRAPNTDHPQPSKACLVERPPAVMAMMEAVLSLAVLSAFSPVARSWTHEIYHLESECDSVQSSESIG